MHQNDDMQTKFHPYGERCMDHPRSRKLQPGKVTNVTGWWFPIQLKNMSQNGNLPQIWGEHKKTFETTTQVSMAVSLNCNAKEMT